MMHNSKGTSLIVLLLAALLFASASHAAEILKVATHSSGPGTPRADYLVRLSKSVEQRTNGRIKIQIFWANSLVHAKEALEAIQTGSTDIADLSAAYFADKLPLVQVATLPFAVSDPVKQRDGMLRVLDKIPQVKQQVGRFGGVVIGVTATATYQLPSHKPIRNLADLKGKKVGTFGRIVPKVIKAAGAVPVSVSAGEMYEALQRGTVDARVLSYESTQRFKLHEVVKNISHVDVGALAGVNLLTVSKKKWDKLSKEDQKILLEEGEAVGKWEAKAMRDGDEEFKAFLKKQGVTIVQFDNADREKWMNSPDVKNISGDWVKSMDKKGLPGQKALDIFLGK